MENEIYKAWDIEAKCYIPSELFAVTGDGQILVRNSEDEPWTEELIPVKLLRFTEHHVNLDGTGDKLWEDDRVEVWDAYGGHWTGVIKFIDGCWEVQYDEPQWDRVDKLMRKRLYLKCFIINHSIKRIGSLFNERIS